MENNDYWKNETIAFLALASVKGVGYWTLHKISEKGVGYKSLLKAETPNDLQNHLRTPIEIETSWEEFQLELWNRGIEAARSLSANKIRLIFRNQEGFPKSLSYVADAPHWLFFQGQLDCLNSTSVAIVGTRKPTEEGRFLTSMTIASLAHKQVTIVSGLAEGIDHLAHVEALAYDLKTIAILGNGLSVEYPAGSNKLKSEIIEKGGLIISEYLPDQIYSAENFVRRNRLQAALSNLVIPIEWKIKSGTAHTVNFADKYNKKLAAVTLPKANANKEELGLLLNLGGRSFELPNESLSLVRYIDEEIIPPQPELEL